jgi:hypothetical protein
MSLDLLTRKCKDKIGGSSSKSSLLFRDRDAKQRWANATSGGWNMGLGGFGGQILAGAVKNSVGRVFSSGG